ncbi:putative disease resistance protein At4g11170 [Brassica napus]|uniref:putative disease resistance protein At4g11170 n=1 Tax=Brassica napus TaxID=3708 RepID=UPI000BBF00F5|nr:putative disease resistance protein At4g11170 [Brassica napus]
MDPVQNRMASDRSFKYGVFISFRGPDTRKIFVGHLYGSLSIRGISTFKDDRRLEPGDSITDELCQAIRASRFAVVVISKNYATSSWCLDELQLIMELVENKEIEVVPIFYEVKPSDVRHHQLLESFSLRMTEKVPGWTKALKDIANRKGMESSKFSDDATMIEEIVQNISSRLLPMLPIGFRDVVGMRAHMKVLSPLLDMDSKDDARIIGIVGTGGIGKTTIAEYLYQTHKLGFSPHHYFMENVAERCRKHGLLHLQNELFSSIFREKNVMLESVEHGRQQLEFRLRNAKVFLVFDDVDDVRQLDALAKEVQWFAPGSRIIITTRDKSLLNSCEVYDVEYLDDDKALLLFQQIAFKGGQPPSSVYSDFSSRASKLAQGLPLAVKALGSSLRGKSEMEWDKALRSFEKAPYDNIPRILNISYESLDELSKTAFLHVACLFNGELVSRVKSLLHRGEDGIRVLAEKSLIDLSTNGRIAMHHLLEKIGRRNESDNDLALQPILRHWYDICRLADRAGTTRTEGIVLDISERPNHIDWKVFMQMENLKYLKINNRRRYKSLDSRTQSNPDEILLPYKLRLLQWDAYPYTTLPSSINTDCLVEVILCNSKLTTLWSGSPPRLSHLKRLNLTGSMYLKELPDLKEAVYLEELMLEGCISLTRIPESICSLPRLQKLDLSNCDGLKNLIIIVKESEATFFEGRRILHVRSVHTDFLDAEPLAEESRDISLTNLSIKGNLKIELKVIGGYAQHFSFISEQHIPHQVMLLEQQTARLMSHPYNFKLLHIVQVNCSEQRDPFKCYSFSYFPWLMELNLINLNIEEIPDDIHHMQVLEKLNLSGNFFRGLPSSMTHLTKLKHVRLFNCRRLEALPQLYQLETLTLSDCTNLHTLVSISHAEQDHGRYNLLELRLDNCKHVETLSDQLRFLTKLTYLDISRHDFETVPTSIKDLSSLITLCLNYCKKLKSLSELPLSIKHLYSHGCMSLETFSLSIDHSVDDLDLSTCFQPNQFLSQFTRFPSGRRSEEVQLCACIQKPKILNTPDQGTRNVRTIYTERFSSETLKLMAFALCLGVLLLCKTMGNS